MCHDPSTAERFYVALPDKSKGYEVRQMRLKALKKAASRGDAESDDSSEKGSDDSSEAEEPIYNDDPESSSSPSEEEMRVWRQKKKMKKSQGEQLQLYIASPSKCEVSGDKTEEKSCRRLF